jgi:2-keto-4-pentenoate hydratase/2-oxohepta-3-ene-1,7-dioic acid hydratase in catechol pathway
VHSLRDLGCDVPSLIDLIVRYDDRLEAELKVGLARAGEDGLPLARVELQAPIPHPRHDILCVGQNYRAHAIESARYEGKEWKQPDWPVYFSKRVDRCVAPDGRIPAHAGITSRLDYEAELAVIVGKTASRVKPGDVFKHIFGYTIANDVSARDIQMNHVQWIFGKGLDGFAPLGPWIATADEIPAPPRLAIRTRVNGEIRQDSNTGDFIFDIPRLISELSSGITLEPGDILITGTPSGVGMGFNPPKFLKPGDSVECEIEGIGVLRNVVA